MKYTKNNLFMNNKIKYVVVLLILIAMPALVCAKEGVRSHFLYHGPGIAAMGMAKAYTAAGDDVSVSYYNPSLLARIKRSDAMVSHTFLYNQASYDFIGINHSLGNTAVSVTGSQMLRDELQIRESINDEPEYASDRKLLITGTFSGKINLLDLYYGATVNYLQYDIYKYSGYGMGLDVGLSKTLYGDMTSDNVEIKSGINCKNVYSVPITMISEEEDLPFFVKAGISAHVGVMQRYDKNTTSFVYDKLKIEIDADYKESRVDLSYGAAYELMGNYIMRAGYDENISAGASIKAGDMRIDYAFDAKKYTNFHNIAFTYTFKNKPQESRSVYY